MGLIANNDDQPLPGGSATDRNGERDATGVVALGLVWLHVPMVAALAWQSDGTVLLSGGFALASAIAGTLAWRFIERGAACIALAICLAAGAYLAILGMNDPAWHGAASAYPFAMQAPMALLLDWRGPVAGAATTTVLAAAGGLVAGHALDPAFLLPFLASTLLLGCVAAALAAILRRLADATDQARSMKRAAITGIEAAKTARDVYKAALEGKARSIDERKDFEQQVAQDRDVAIAAVSDGLSRLSDGDLTVRLAAPLPEGFEPLYQSFNDAVDGLAWRLDPLVQQATAIDVPTDLGEQARHLLQSASRQAKAVSGLAGHSRNANAAAAALLEKTGEASKAVAEARSRAELGGTTFHDAMRAMADIGDSSKEIAKIIGMIESIAVQTNLLALNAGVEAARAGDHGRGFAVVASEVRALAQRSAQAAKDVKSLITVSTRQVGEGARLVTEIGDEVARLQAEIASIEPAVVAVAESGRDVVARLGQVDDLARSVDRAAPDPELQSIMPRLNGLCEALADLSRAAGALRIRDDGQDPMAHENVARISFTQPARGEDAGPTRPARGMLPAVDGATARKLVDHA